MTRNATAVLIRFVAFLLAVSGCSSSAPAARDASVAAHAARDAGSDAAHADAGKRVKLRTVTIQLPPIATRELSQGSNGQQAYGDIQPLDGVNVCVKQRRDAFAVFMPFDEIDSPKCIKSVAGQAVTISDVPANSDLVITAEYPGLRSLVVTARTGDADATEPWVGGFSLIMLKPAVEAPWLQPGPEVASDHGLVGLAAATFWSNQGQTTPEVVAGSEAFFGTVEGFALVPDVHLDVQPSGASEAIEITSATRKLAFLSLPAGSARIRVSTDNPHLRSCGPPGNLIGLSAATDGTFELPVLPGYDHFAGPLCSCVGDSPADQLLDLATCTFAPAAPPETDAGTL